MWNQGCDSACLKIYKKRISCAKQSKITISVHITHKIIYVCLYLCAVSVDKLFFAHNKNKYLFCII